MVISRPIRSLLFLLFAVCPLLFFTDLTRNPYYTQIALLNLFVCACWVIWLFQALQKNEFLWVSSAFDTALLSLIGVCVTSWLLSMCEHPGVIKSIYSEGSKAAIFLLINTFLIYAAALRARDPALVRMLLWTTYAVCFFAALYGICQYFGVELIWPSSLNPYGNRPVSTFGNPNFMSSFLVVVIPVMVADYLFNATGCPRAILFIVIQLSVSVLLATLTRSSWAGLFAGLVVLFYGIRSLGPVSTKGKAALWITFVALIFLWPRGGTESGFTPTVISRLTEVKKMAHEGYASVYQRFLIWLSAWGMVLDHPFLGRGWGNFELFYPFYQGPLLLEKGLSYRTHANNAHNEVLEYWSQVGTVGLGIMLWMWALFFRLGASLSRRLQEPSRAMLWGFLGGVAGMLIDNLMNVSVHFAVPAFIFWWWVGSAMATDEAGLQIHRLNLGPAWKKVIVGLCMTGLLLLMGRAVCLWAAEVNFFKGFKMSKAGVDLVSASHSLERAYAWHHLEVNNNYELGNVYARLGDREKALWMYQRALDANAGYDEIYFNRATMLMQMGHVDEAIASYRLCLAINPLSQQAYNALAGLYFKDITRYSSTIEALYTQGVLAFPGDKDMWNNLGYLYTQQQQWGKAAVAYQKALEIDPQFELAKRNLAVVLEKQRASAALKR